MRNMTREERRYWRRETIKAVSVFGVFLVLAAGLPNWL